MGGPCGPPISLSPRETAILRQIAIPHSEGMLLTEIAAKLKPRHPGSPSGCVSSPPRWPHLVQRKRWRRDGERGRPSSRQFRLEQDDE
jgi:hypothetical protein